MVDENNRFRKIIRNIVFKTELRGWKYSWNKMLKALKVARPAGFEPATYGFKVLRLHQKEL